MKRSILLFLKQKRFLDGYILIEVLVSLSILAFSITFFLIILSSQLKVSVRDNVIHKFTEYSYNYLTQIYLSTNLFDSLFSEEDKSVISNSAYPPIYLNDMGTNIENDLVIYTYKKIRRIRPLLVDIAIEGKLRGQTGLSYEKELSIETTFSEAFLHEIQEP